MITRRRQAYQVPGMLGVLHAAGPAGVALRPGRWVILSEWEQGLLFRYGQLVTTLAPGRHRRWGAGFTLRAVDMRPWILTLPTQEVPTADGATVKVTVAGQAKVTDPVAYVTAAQDARQGLYLAIQVALREVFASTPLDALLAGRAELGSRLAEAVRGVDQFGLAVEQLEIKDVILPGELKKAQAQVLVARAQGLAALERARGETAALRSLANAARLAADNPSLVQLRLLQQLEMSAGHTVVIGTGLAGTPS
ncbi:MAG TPA: slipin family protein [Streptosporangiaceae bacterium]|nr:slipin family protein [Streptosporangiaceae bacterium]